MFRRLADAVTDRRAFAVAWTFLAIASALGLLLRVQTLHPIVPLNYAYALHAHSHVAFLGWVYNAFFAVTLRHLALPSDASRYRALFVVTQMATLGMLCTFPFQGYAAASISFSTLHVACEGTFGWFLLRRNRATPAARLALRWAFAFMFISAAGPIALGPIAASGLRGSTWYSLAIYFYLHFQYNGWFIFFLLAVLFLRGAEKGGLDEPRARRAVHWLAVGCLLTVTLSALWANPPRMVAFVGVLGAAAQVIGAGYLARSIPGFAGWFGERAVRRLVQLAAAAFLIKLALQFASGWPGIVALASQRMVVIGFLHLVFLGAVTPMVLAWAVTAGWIRIRGIATGGLLIFLAGALVTELALFSQPVPAVLSGVPPWPRLAESLALGAALLFAGVVLMFAGFRRDPRPAASGTP